jgi:hypothetical protein
LPHRRLITRESEPLKIFEQGGLELASASHAIVIFDPQEDPTAARAHDAPHIHGIDDVSEVEEAGRRRRETRYDVAH